MQGRRSSSAFAIELRLCCTKPSICPKEWHGAHNTFGEINLALSWRIENPAYAVLHDVVTTFYVLRFEQKYQVM